ncbi:hypothetical protein F5Y07DRAFT_400392 [Xylaria sp. FL0933]|nr:hypothetical protein F5Y07DRAFT_400392 [Xylaria sp. FL0933]
MMETDDWKSNEKSEGYSDLMWEQRHMPMRIIKSLQHQRPWNSKIRLPQEADTTNGADFCHLESHDLDCLLVLIRMLMSLGFCPQDKYRRTAIMRCAGHDFGWDRRSDYLAKGMLVQKLFPESLDNMDSLRSKLTFENLLRHPGVDKVIFACRAFSLKNPQLFISDPDPRQSAHIESIKPSSYEDMTNENEVKWDGIKTLEQTIAGQSYDLDLRAENKTKISRRFCTVPDFIRVMFTPGEGRPRSFDDVRRFQLKSPTIQYGGNGMVREVMSNSTYILHAVVKMDPEHPIWNPAEVRLYDVGAKMILPERQCNNDHRDLIGQKIRPDSKWKLGDPKFKFMLFYSRWDSPNDELPPNKPIQAQEPARVNKSAQVDDPMQIDDLVSIDEPVLSVTSMSIASRTPQPLNTQLGILQRPQSSELSHDKWQGDLRACMEFANRVGDSAPGLRSVSTSLQVGEMSRFAAVAMADGSDSIFLIPGYNT